MVAALAEALPSVITRDGSTRDSLNQKLAAHLRCDPGRLQALHGASQIFPILKRMAGSRPVLRPEPTFDQYARTFSRGAAYRDAPGVDLEALDASITPDAIVIIVTPNSPTGTLIPTAWIHDCARRHGHTLFVVDESFLDYSGETSLVDRLEGDPVDNIFVVKSLSNSLGVPGLRIGFVYTSNPEVVRVLDDEIPERNLSGPAELYLDLLVHHRDELARSLERTKQDRTHFAGVLAATPAVRRVHPSAGNFFMLDLRARDPILGLRVKEEMLARYQIELEDVSKQVLPNLPRIRVAVRTPDEHTHFCEALTQVAATL